MGAVCGQQVFTDAEIQAVRDIYSADSYAALKEATYSGGISATGWSKVYTCDHTSYPGNVYPDCPPQTGDNYWQKTKRGGSAVIFVLARVRGDGSLAGTRQFGFTEPYSLSEFKFTEIIKDNSLIPSTPGDYLFVVSLYGWRTKSDPAGTFIPSDTKYFIHRKPI
jgi:hypothetical protein